jgi:succinoglycan biosynthesis protein ExoO
MLRCLKVQRFRELRYHKEARRQRKAHRYKPGFLIDTQTISSSLMTQTSVSVLIPAFNVAYCIGTAIESALAQSLPPTEIIVVDDASTDGTADVVTAIAKNHPTVKLIRKSVNEGVAAARNTGIEAATADWIAILDADDRYLPDRLKYLVGAAEEKQLDFAADSFYNYDSHADKIVGVAIPPSLIGASLDLDRYDFVRNCMTSMAGAVDFGLLKPIVRRSFLESTGVRYQRDVRHGEDFIFYLTALVHRARFSVFPEAHYVYTQRLGSVSRKHSSLTRTRVDLSEVEAESRRLASSELTANDPKLAELLTQRADRTKVARKFFQFRDALRERRFIEAARRILADGEVRSCAAEAIQAKLKRDFRSLRRNPL